VIKTGCYNVGDGEYKGNEEEEENEEYVEQNGSIFLQLLHVA
jgi:hypothetical protein